MSIKEILEQIIFDQNIRLRKEYMPDCNGEYYVNKNGIAFITILPEYEGPHEEDFVLGHELGHHFTGVSGDLMAETADGIDVSRAEHRANRWATEWFMPVERLIEAHEKGITGPLDLADYVGIPIEELCRGLDMYYSIHGPRTIHGQYVIDWNPFRIKRDKRRKP